MIKAEVVEKAVKRLIDLKNEHKTPIANALLAALSVRNLSNYLAASIKIMHPLEEAFRSRLLDFEKEDDRAFFDEFMSLLNIVALFGEMEEGEIKKLKEYLDGLVFKEDSLKNYFSKKLGVKVEPLGSGAGVNDNDLFRVAAFGVIGAFKKERFQFFPVEPLTNNKEIAETIKEYYKGKGLEIEDEGSYIKVINKENIDDEFLVSFSNYGDMVMITVN